MIVNRISLHARRFDPAGKWSRSKAFGEAETFIAQGWSPVYLLIIRLLQTREQAKSKGAHSIPNLFT